MTGALVLGCEVHLFSGVRALARVAIAAGGFYGAIDDNK